MARGEPFKPGYAIHSFVEGLSWFKALMIGLKILGIAFIGLTIYRAYFMPTKEQKQETKIVVEKGGTMHLVQKQEMEEDKRPWWLPVAFVEPYGFTESDGRTGFGGRGGLRWEF